MLKLSASYSKVVPAQEKFGSQSYLASVEVGPPNVKRIFGFQVGSRDWTRTSNQVINSHLLYH